MVKVSVITPVHELNVVSILRSMESLLRQSCKDFEWIVVLDCLDDDYNMDDLDEVMYLASKDHLFGSKVVNLNRNYGPSVARNVGFQVSNGDYIAYLDSGDEYSPDRVEHIINVFDNMPDTHLLIDGHTIINPDKAIYNWNPAELIKKGLDVKSTIQKQNITIPLSFSHRRAIFNVVGGFQRGIVCGEDGIMIRRMFEILQDKKNAVVFTDHVAGLYNVSLAGQSRTQRRFTEGGFAFDAGDPGGSHGQYLDKNWWTTLSSKEWFDK
jgi:glycosyltransferase involved in cell wall biosynthesis